jgi:hypothetical protein
MVKVGRSEEKREKYFPPTMQEMGIKTYLDFLS